jgi:hypothetical protein
MRFVAVRLDGGAATGTFPIQHMYPEVVICSNAICSNVCSFQHLNIAGTAMNDLCNCNECVHTACQHLSNIRHRLYVGVCVLLDGGV